MTFKQHTAPDVLTLEARTTLASLTPLPLYGKNVRLILLNEGTVVSTFGAFKGLIGKSAAAALHLLDESRDALASFAADTSGTPCLAIPVPNHDRILLAFRAEGIKSSAILGFIPDIGASSVARVLCHSFAHCVSIPSAVMRLGDASPRKTDAKTYAHIASLLENGRRLPLRNGRIEIADRRMLSDWLDSLLGSVFALLGIEDAPPSSLSFPLEHSFAGTLCLTPAFWMLLCLFGGLYRTLPTQRYSTVRLSLDDEHLLPVVSFASGNRTRLPSEWEECRRIAAHYGMFFDIHRTRDTVYVRFCPMTPSAQDAAEFYRLCAPADV